MLTPGRYPATTSLASMTACWVATAVPPACCCSLMRVLASLRARMRHMSHCLEWFARCARSLLLLLGLALCLDLFLDLLERLIAEEGVVAEVGVVVGAQVGVDHGGVRHDGV